MKLLVKNNIFNKFNKYLIGTSVFIGIVQFFKSYIRSQNGTILPVISHFNHPLITFTFNDIIPYFNTIFNISNHFAFSKSHLFFTTDQLLTLLNPNPVLIILMNFKPFLVPVQPSVYTFRVICSPLTYFVYFFKNKL